MFHVSVVVLNMTHQGHDADISTATGYKGPSCNDTSEGLPLTDCSLTEVALTILCLM